MKKFVSILLAGMILLSFSAVAASESEIAPHAEYCDLCFTGTVTAKKIVYGSWRNSSREYCTHGGGAHSVDTLQTRSATRIYECNNPDCGYSKEVFLGNESRVYCEYKGQYYNITVIK